MFLYFTFFGLFSMSVLLCWMKEFLMESKCPSLGAVCGSSTQQTAPSTRVKRF